MARSYAFDTIHRLLLQPYWRLTRGLTFGVRGMCRDDDGRFLLVRHSYAPGWTFPGGGVERGETLVQALAREMSEEAGISFKTTPRLISVFANFRLFPGDHVALFAIDGWRQQPRRSLEIAEHGFFAADSLPEGTTGGTRRRIRELLEELPPAAEW